MFLAFAGALFVAVIRGRVLVCKRCPQRSQVAILTATERWTLLVTGPRTVRREVVQEEAASGAVTRW